MSYPAQISIPAAYYRGGTAKGVFFRLQDLPEAAQRPGPARDALMLRVIGSPDPYGKQIDGMGGATSSTSKTVIISPSTREGHDVDYLFGQVSIDRPFVDWSGNCGNLSPAVGPFAIRNGMLDPSRIPEDGTAVVRIWQVNTGKTIVVHVPMSKGEVQEAGIFKLDGIPSSTAEIPVEFMNPAADDGECGGSMFPTGNVVDELDVPGIGLLKATLTNVGIPTVFIQADALGYQGTELQDEVNSDTGKLALFEKIRAIGAMHMGLIQDIGEAAVQQHTPKIAFVAPPSDYTASNGRKIAANNIDLSVRALSMGKMHHAMMGTAAVAIAAMAAVPGTTVNQAAGGGSRENICFGHPSGTQHVGARVFQQDNGTWTVESVNISLSARLLMEGRVYVPSDSAL